MLVLDDTLLFPLAIMGFEPLPMPNVYMLTLRVLRDQTLKEMYPLEKIQDSIKENRLQYELGDITQQAYEEMQTRFFEHLRIAKRVREKIEGLQVNLLSG